MVELTFTLGSCDCCSDRNDSTCCAESILMDGKGTAKDLEMSGGCVCILYPNLPTHCFWHDCYLIHLEPVLTVIQDSTWRTETENLHSMSVGSPSQRLPSRFVESYIQAQATPPEGSTMSISEPTASTPARLTDQTWLNPTLVLTLMSLMVTHFSDICLYTFYFYCFEVPKC